MIPLAALLIAAVVAAILYWQYARHYESTDDAFIAGRATQINPKVSGYVAALYVDDNQSVDAGKVLVQIDPADFEAALAQSRAALEAARNRVKDAESQITLALATERSAVADVASADAAANNAARVLERAEKAIATVPEAVTGQDLDQAKADARTTAANLTSSQAKSAQARAQTAARRADLATAQADVRQAEAQVRTAELNVGYTKIVASVPGRVTHRTVEKGDYLQAGQALLAIVQPTLWVVANFKETQLELMKVGQPVTVRVDAFPGRKLQAHVDSFQRGTGAEFSLLPPENATGNYVKVVQRVPVKIVFDEPPPEDMILGPGMSVVPTVKVR
jgi:membrane fusion protein (multidrug efflux system)